MKTDKNRFSGLVCASALSLLGATTARGQGPNYDPGCAVPFAEIATTPDPFVSCGNCGVVPTSATATQAAAKAAESKAKSNLCGDMTKKTVVDFSILTKMQALNALGGWAQLKIRANSKLEFNGAAGQEEVVWIYVSADEYE